MKCPGQDTRYWKPGDIFEFACPSCGGIIEFFKDEGTRKCPRCGSRVCNPKVDGGCAQWCAHAAECLGIPRKAVPLPAADEGVAGSGGSES